MKRHCRKDGNPKNFPHGAVTKQQYFGIVFDFLLIFPAIAKESWEDFLKTANEKKPQLFFNMGIMLIALST